MELLINGKKYSAQADPQESLLSVLRNDLELTGIKLKALPLVPGGMNIN